MSGIAIGLVAAVPLAALAWWLGADLARPVVALASVVCGAAAGILVQRRRALSDEEIALYLDRKLDSAEVISTAFAIRDEDVAAAVVVSRATAILETAEPSRTRPRLLRRLHGFGPAGLAAVVALSLLALPSAPVPASPAPGEDLVVIEDVSALDRAVAALEATKGRDPAEDERLAALAERARALRERLGKGMERREALSELSEIGDALAAESMTLGDGERRRGLEAALAALDAAQLKSEKRALAERDMGALESALDRSARSRDSTSRDNAKRGLTEAADAARTEGAEDVARALEDQRRRFDATEKKAERLREIARKLGDHLSDDAKKALERFEAKGDADAQKELAQALEASLSGMSEEEIEQLAKELEDLARATPPSSEAERARQLEAAQEAVSEMRAGAGEGAPSAADRPGSSSDDPLAQEGGSATAGSAAGSSAAGAQGSPGAGGSSNKKPGTPTPGTSASSDRVRASAKLLAGETLPGDRTTLGPGRSGDTANVRGAGALGDAAAEEIGAVTQTDVPEEYREQVGRYFRP